MKKTGIIIGLLFFVVGFAASLLVMRMGIFETGEKEQKKSADIVLTSFQSTFSLTKALTKETSILTINIFPPHIRMDHQENYLKKHEHKLIKLFKKATAVVSIRYAWPNDPIFPYARSKNIKTIEIDSSMSFDPLQSGVALQDKNKSPFIWLSLTNFTKSADIVATDLKHIFPNHAGQIEKNVTRLKRRVFKIRSDYESRFADLENCEVVALTDDFAYFTDNLNIGVIKYFLKPEIHWTKKDLYILTKILEENKIKATIHKWNPEKQIMKAIQKTGAKVVILQTIDPGKKKGNSLDTDGYLKMMRNNLESLYQGLNSDGVK